MQAHVDKDTCIGCGVCPSVAPEVFAMDDDGKAVEIVESVPESSADSAKEAEDSCPVNAISVE
ncbi:ferredoxin [Clostridium pasteurianum DSM 525 = ATCC 6013]|uniref:Ferredoxin n=1 Tax=Clostridium pasteurianum DSM 525 = ATCC 6013 TaxID=1262449 RepID=A0A0H3J2Y6_CLOPA|nr:ferredoxin [Clostridium pasteurianum]AJA46278.1 ferredoxin [Clostridium pasteurianum DSM 525 = ATCC 6013]AJA50266.1 ferredoxin [Clostridium pasteurianum DSM 525 = ATCC 6013]AOZ73730.1 ferredoxin [Clostridium pasteurianum DSM 525 = ATCC 6013]AOZ77527.1 ferredoxin [Clostridium pasteurianum]ELP60862.1 ferredoxin [Clostridium pasteurianum DSM 525 = ATCC 6013]